MNVFPFPTPALPAMVLPESLGAVVAKRGRKLGVKTVSSETNEHRRQWLLAVMAQPGANAELCRRLKASDAFVSHLIAGRRTFTDALAMRIELVLGLKSGGIDAGISPHPVVYQSDVDDSKAERGLDESIERALLGMLTCHPSRPGG